MPALSLAVYHGHLAAVAYLLAHKASPNTLDGSEGQGPLHYAAHAVDRAECAELLLAAGAELEMCNQLGETAGGLATRLRLPNVSALLGRAQRKQDCLAAVRSAMAPWWPLSVDCSHLAAAISAAEQAGVESEKLRPARALLAEAPASVDWASTAFRLVGVSVSAAGVGPTDCELEQVPEAPALQLGPLPARGWGDSATRGDSAAVSALSKQHCAGIRGGHGCFDGGIPPCGGAAGGAAGGLGGALASNSPWTAAPVPGVGGGSSSGGSGAGGGGAAVLGPEP